MPDLNDGDEALIDESHVNDKEAFANATKAMPKAVLNRWLREVLAPYHCQTPEDFVARVAEHNVKVDILLQSGVLNDILAKD